MLLMYPYGLVHCFPEFLLADPFMASETNHGSSHTCSRKYSCPKFKIYVSEPILDSYKYMPVAYVTVLYMIGP
jgi:hypothetical protein